ncbi:hypothetical protein SD81_038815 [Tolypothrix campylonemoides VB511288]|nr:hypothetical protein SD81_038815 [Tolypothrix campylonemoides VB511288]
MSVTSVRQDTTLDVPSPNPTSDTLRPGETLADFAARHRVSEQAVREANASLLQTVNQDRRHHEPGLSESQALAGATLAVPPQAMSVGRDPVGSDFNPTYPSPNSEYTVGGQGQAAGGAVTWNPGDGSVKVTGSAIATPPGQQDTAPVQFEARRDTAVTLGQVNKDGNTEFTVEVQATDSATASASTRTSRGLVEGEATAGAGLRARYKVVLPGENQTPEAAARVNPFDPTTIPVGATVTLDGQAFTQTAMEGAFRHIGIKHGLTEAAGASYSVTRVDENRVRVTTGPNEAVEAFNGIGVTTQVATAMLGRQDNLGFSSVGTATFDLSDPDAQAAYAHFVATGDVAHATPGVSDVAQIARVDFSSQTRAQLELGPLSADLAGAQNTGSRVDITYPDGSSTSVMQLQYSGNVPLQVTQRFDAAGNEVVSERSYQFTVSTDHKVDLSWWDNLLGRSDAAAEQQLESSHAQLLNTALTGDLGAGGPIRPGQKATITFTEEQMTAFREQTRAAAESNPGSDPFDLLVGGQHGQPVASNMDFAVSWARNLGNSDYGIAERLFVISQNADGDFRNGTSRIEATVEAK